MISLWLSSLPFLLLMGLAGWWYAWQRGNVNIVDSLWSLFFLAAALMYWLVSPASGATALLLLLLVALWSLRLSLYLALRNRAKPEDRRYRAMRERNPHFATQSLLTVFGLQAVLAWLISLPLAAALYAPAPFGWLHATALALFVIGFFFEASADWQLARFKQDPSNQGRVLDSGVWHYSRHPNYFGEACMWWAFFLFALASGYAWVILSPLLMTFLLLKVSGVSLLEKDIGERRPAYRRYVETTSAFFPWFPQRAAVEQDTKENAS